MHSLFTRSKRHPSAILLFVQLLGVLLYPFMETTSYGHIGLNLFGMVVLAVTVNMVRKTPGLTWVAASLAVPVVVLLVLQIAFAMPQLLPWSSLLEAIFYFHAAGSLIAYMMEDYTTSTDELFASAATFTLLVWGFTHLFVMIQSLDPGAFSDGTSVGPRTWSELNHLSFALLSSTGMGNIVAMSAYARAVASIAMVVGVLYLATVVARLIGFTTHPKK